jgi:hypothetical protein
LTDINQQWKDDVKEVWRMMKNNGERYYKKATIEIAENMKRYHKGKYNKEICKAISSMKRMGYV